MQGIEGENMRIYAVLHFIGYIYVIYDIHDDKSDRYIRPESRTCDRWHFLAMPVSLDC